MFRIRKLAGALTPADAAALAAAQAIIRARLPGLRAEDVDEVSARLADPFAKRFVCEALVAEDGRDRVRGAAVLMHDPAAGFAWLDLLAAEPRARGVGAALYERAREEAAARGAHGLYFECLPDDPKTCPDPRDRAANAARLRFYERFGARPIIGTAYETPLSPDDAQAPVLVLDPLGASGPPDAATLRAVVRAVLERKYARLCPPDYVATVLNSIKDGAYALRPPRWRGAAAAPSAAPPSAAPPSAADPSGGERPIPMVVNDRHDIHHIRERGYVEAPARVDAIRRELERAELVEAVAPRRFPDRWIRAVHDPALIDYLRSACAEAPEKTSVYPYIFPVRNATRRPKERSVLAGYWCVDTFTPINRNAWPAARRAADCALTAADAALSGARLSYALVRPPGHHAERRTFGGFCYLCNGAIAAEYLAAHGRVAILDIDYHHGNGQQDVFYARGDVLTVSIHGDPSFAYPYFTGFRDETGVGDGAGANLNIPLPETIAPADYDAALARALARIAEHDPRHLVLSVGFDTARGDPTGTWPLGPDDFRRIGRAIAGCGWPTVVVQEGGYRIRDLGRNARAFFEGLAAGARTPAPARPRAAPEARRLTWRAALRPGDPARIRRLVAGTGRFSAEEIAIAEELPAERIARGRASGYEFTLACRGEALAGYACFGRIPGSETAWDLYWIAVAPDAQGAGLGARLLGRVVDAVRAAGGAALYADTSSSAAYAATRRFYARRGFALAAEFPDFYRPGDGKAVYRLEIAPCAATA
jgi:acetoin utilization deacetylase AcuC-like enzyme/L-amino acid N-acyltransferase YncA